YVMGARVSVNSLSSGSGATATTGGFNGNWVITSVNGNSFSFVDTNPGTANIPTAGASALTSLYLTPTIVETLSDGTVTVPKGIFAAQGLRGVAFAPVAATAINLVVNGGSSATVTPGTSVTLTATLSNAQVASLAGKVSFIDQTTGLSIGTA